MPHIRIDGPRVEDLDKKRKFVKHITQEAAELFGFAEEDIVIVFRENSGENVAVGGKLFIDRIGGKPEE